MEDMRMSLTIGAGYVGRAPGFFDIARYLALLGLLLLASLFINGVAQAADTQKPTAPTGLNALEIWDTGAYLSWTPSSDDVGIAGYHIERCTGGGCTTWAEIATTTHNSYSANDLIPWTTYRFRVRAADAAGNFSNYSTTNFKTADYTAPTAPSPLSATVNSAIKITLTWATATDNVKVTGYRIERCVGTGCGDFVEIATTATALTYGSTELTPSTVYRYRVRAVDAAGNFGDYSNIVTAVSLADTIKPTAPTGLTAITGSSSQIDLNWVASTDAAGVTGYRIERCTGATCANYIEIATTPNTSYSNTGLTAATAYRYRIRANDASGNLSKYSEVVGVTTQSSSDTQVPTVPSNLNATSTSAGRIVLNWSASTDDVGVTGYRVKRCQGVGCTVFTLIAVVAATNYVDSGLAATTSYSYRVSAVDGAGNASAFSTTSSATTLSTGGSITFTYSYDGLGRLVQAVGSDGSVIGYQYDANGNLLSINRQ